MTMNDMVIEKLIARIIGVVLIVLWIAFGVFVKRALKRRMDR